MACRTPLIPYAVMYLYMYIPYNLLAVSLFYSVFFFIMTNNYKFKLMI